MIPIVVSSVPELHCNHFVQIFALYYFQQHPAAKYVGQCVRQVPKTNEYVPSRDTVTKCVYELVTGDEA